MNDGADTPSKSDQVTTKLSIDPLVLESAKITLATTGIDLSTYIEASLRQLVQKNGIPFGIAVDSITWSDEKTIRKSVRYITSGLYFEARNLILELAWALSQSELRPVLTAGLVNLSQEERFNAGCIYVALITLGNAMKATVSKSSDCLDDTDSEKWAHSIRHYSEIVEQRVTAFLSNHSMEIEPTIRNTFSPESEAAILYRFELFDSLYSGVLECFKRHPERFTAYLSYYDQESLLEIIRDDLASMTGSQQEQQ